MPSCACTSSTRLAERCRRSKYACLQLTANQNRLITLHACVVNGGYDVRFIVTVSAAVGSPSLGGFNFSKDLPANRRLRGVPLSRVRAPTAATAHPWAAPAACRLTLTRHQAGPGARRSLTESLCAYAERNTSYCKHRDGGCSTTLNAVLEFVNSSCRHSHCCTQHAQFR